MVIIFILFLLFTLNLWCYYFCIFRKLIQYKRLNKNKTQKPVSVIICAKDEANNLKKFLPEIYAQDYPDFEVILIDDRSLDDTFDVLKSFEEKYPEKTKIVKVNFSNDTRLSNSKKYALTLGIKAAKHNHLLFTDADCRPVSQNWITQMTGQFSPQKQLVLGYGKYAEKAGFLNKIIRYETVQTALQYFSYALSGKPYMGVGRNLAYTKDLFMNNNGFYSHLDLLSGDDDLFVNEVATRDNTAICLHPDSFTLSQPKNRWTEYIYQKRRHISTAGHYKKQHKILLAWYFTALSGFWLTAAFLLANLYLPYYVSGIIFARLLPAWYINAKTNQKFNEKHLTAWYPVLEIVLICLQFYIFVINLFKKPDYWRH